MKSYRSFNIRLHSCSSVMLTYGRGVVASLGLVALLATLSFSTIPVLAAAQHDIKPVRLFSDGSSVPGSWSTLLRTSSGVTMTLHTSGLASGDAVTIWWVVFNHPEFCSQGVFGLRCGKGDLANPSVDASVLYAAGHVIGGDGVANYGAHLAVGELRIQVLFGPGLTNPMGADIHLIVHDHGPMTPALMPAEIHSFDVCNPICVDLQHTAHEA